MSRLGTAIFSDDESAPAAATIPAPGADHGGLTGLTDDDHTQYALLLGRATGQIIRGGTAASETLTLRGTSHATVGLLVFNDLGGDIQIGGAATQSVLRFMEGSAGGTQYVGLQAPATVAANRVHTLPDLADSTVAVIAGAQTLTDKTLAAPIMTGTAAGASMTLSGTLVIGTAPNYTVTNETVDRTFDANATTIDELADVLGTLIEDLIVMGLLQ